VAGYALGGGCELALACDLRVAAETAKFGQPEVLLGILPGAGGTQRLTRLVGPARAKDMVLGGRQVRAQEALAIGLADRVFPAAVLSQEARAVAAGFAQGATAAQALAKRAIDAAYDLPLAEGITMEQELFVQVFDTEDARIGVQSFLEHGPGKATFTGR
jgi:enoyl-CoA hydratase